jgi:hypothetical protein
MRTYTKLFAGLALCFILTPQLSRGQFRHEVTLSITNNPQTNAALILNGETRGWRLTNSSTTVAVTNDIGWSRTNLLLNLTAYPLAVQANVRYGSSTSDIVIVGMTNIILTLSTVSNWCSWVYSTSLVYGASAVRTPYTVESNALRQWQMSCLATSLVAYATNIVKEGSVMLSNYVSLTNVQAFSNKTISGSALQWGQATGLTNLTATNIVLSTGVVAYAGLNLATNLSGSGGWYTNLNLQGPTLTNATVSITNGYITNVIGHTMTITNLASPGQGLRSEKLGIESIASNANCIAFGYQAMALGEGTMAFGALSMADENAYSSIAVGTGAFVGGATNSTAIGPSVIVSKSGATGVGYLARAQHLHSSAIGAHAATTTTNQIRIGNTTNHVSIAGELRDVRATNVWATGTNRFTGFVGRDEEAITTLAAGANIITLGTAPDVVISGTASSWSLDGITNNQWTGNTIIVKNGSGVAGTLTHESGLAPIAATRLDTGGGSVTLSDGQSACFRYNSASRWELKWPRLPAAVNQILVTNLLSVTNTVSGPLTVAGLSTLATVATTGATSFAGSNYAALGWTVPVFLTNELIKTTWATTNFNGSNTLAGLLTIPTGLGTVSVTNNLVTTNSIVALAIGTPGVASNVWFQATAGLLTIGVSHGPSTNCIVTWHLLNP